MEELLIQMQQAKQEQEAEYRRRRSFVRVALILLVIVILLRILGTAQGGIFAVKPAIADPGGQTRPVGAAAVMQVEWASYCDPAKVGLAAYGENTIPCSPSQVVSLPALQDQLTAAGVLQKGEYLTLAIQSSTACRVAVVNGDNGLITGWLCAEKNGSGLYRTDAAGQNPGACWQLWSDDKWRLPGQA